MVQEIVDFCVHVWERYDTTSGNAKSEVEIVRDDAKEADVLLFKRSGRYPEFFFFIFHLNVCGKSTKVKMSVFFAVHHPELDQSEHGREVAMPRGIPDGQKKTADRPPLD